MEHRAVRIWLWVGVAMVFVQVIVGGITRLTGSGLSITKWEIVTGTLPPLSAEEWNKEFDLYKETPQYLEINAGMSMGEFKFIYFWEYIHRLWARLIGVVFAVPFVIFLARGWLEKALIRRLLIAVGLGAVVAAFGWVMVASGLVDRPWVNAYKLTIHLNLALLLYAWLFWVALGPRIGTISHGGIKKWLNALTGLLVVQLILGGVMSGMKAAVYYPTWPDMYGEVFPAALLNPEIWTRYYILEAYEQGPMPGVVQFAHRSVAYIITIVSTVIICKSVSYNKNKRRLTKWTGMLGAVVLIQVILGILTLVQSTGSIPLTMGVLHQGMAIILLSVIVVLHHRIST